jgi:hypothetical protein
MRATLTRTRVRVHRFERLRRAGVFSVRVRAILGAPAPARLDPVTPVRVRALTFGDRFLVEDVDRVFARVLAAAFMDDERGAFTSDGVAGPRVRVFLVTAVARRRAAVSGRGRVASVAARVGWPAGASASPVASGAG